jgi:hypothetical protein
MRFFFVHVRRVLNPALPSWKMLRLRVPTRNIREFSLFGVCPSNKHCPSARCACAANAVGKDLDIFAFGAISLTYFIIFYLKLLKIFVQNPNVLVLYIS